MSREAQILIGLGELLVQRNAPVERVLQAIQRAGVETHFFAVSAFTNRIGLILANRPGVLEALLPGHSEPPSAAKGMVRAVVDGDRVSAAVTTTEHRGQRETLGELAPVGAREAWVSTLEVMFDIAPSSIMNSSRYITEPRASIAIEYPARSGEVEARFVRGVEHLAARVGVSEGQRSMWSTLHSLAGANIGLTIGTGYGPTGQLAVLDVLYGAATWHRTIDVTNAILGRTSVEAREVAARLGMIAAALGIDEPGGLEIIFNAGERPEVVVWLAPR